MMDYYSNKQAKPIKTQGSEMQATMMNDGWVTIERHSGCLVDDCWQLNDGPAEKKLKVENKNIKFKIHPAIIGRTMMGLTIWHVHFVISQVQSLNSELVLLAHA